MLEIKVDNAAIKRFERQLAGIPRALPRVMSRGLNRTATEARTKVARSLAQRTGLRIKDVRDRTTLQRASYRNWRSALTISRKRLPLMAFKARQTQKGVTYKQGRKRILIRHAFVATITSGHVGVFKRKTTARLPIVELRGPSLGQVFADAQQEASQIYRESLERLQKNIHDQIQIILRRRAG